MLLVFKDCLLFHSICNCSLLNCVMDSIQPSAKDIIIVSIMQQLHYLARVSVGFILHISFPDIGYEGNVNILTFSEHFMFPHNRE